MCAKPLQPGVKLIKVEKKKEEKKKEVAPKKPAAGGDDRAVHPRLRARLHRDHLHRMKE